MSTILGKDEQKIKEATFTTDLILFWFKANYVLTNKRVTGHTPNTLLGLIPLGKVQIAQPLKTIASVITSTNFSFLRFIIGVVFFILGLTTVGSSIFGGIILLIIGVINILNCFTATFVITNNAGISTSNKISILEKSKVIAFTNEVNTIIADL